MNRLDPPISEHEFVSTFFVGIGFENVGPEKRRLRFQISPLINNYVPKRLKLSRVGCWAYDILQIF